jgi:hypothetical protein
VPEAVYTMEAKMAIEAESEKHYVYSGRRS